MLLRRFCDICTVMMLTCQTSIKRFMSSIRDLFFSYVISLFLLMIFVFDLTNPYWNKYLREKNITWFSTNYHVIIMSCEKKQIFICKAFIFIFILLVIKWEWFFELSHDDHVILIHMIMYKMCVRIVSCLVHCPSSVIIHIQI